jgi:hypothetical protein
MADDLSGSGSECAILLSCLLVFTPGCSGWVRAEAGFVSATTFQPGRQGFSGGLEAALGERRSPGAFDMALRGKVTEKTGDVSLFMGGLYLQKPARVGYYVLGGAYLFQLGITNGDFAFGMFSPAAEAGMLLSLDSKDKSRDVDVLTFGTRIEYDLRFTPQPHEGFLTFVVGYGLAAPPD